MHAVDKDLRRDVDVRPFGFSSNLYSVRERGCGCVRPAGTAVLGDVLVTHVGQVVGAIDVVPNPGGGDVVGWHQSLPNVRLEILGERNVAWAIGVCDSWFSAYVAEKSRCCEILHFY